MRILLVLCCLVTLCISYAEAGLSKIKSVKVIVSAAIASSAYIQNKDINDEVLKDLKGSLSQIKVENSSDFTCEVRYIDDYKLSVINDMYGSYYMSIVIKSQQKNYDKIAASSKVYWERAVFMPLIPCKSLNASVKDSIGGCVAALADDWTKDMKSGK